VPVDITGPGGNQTVVTAPDGCAVFALNTVGNYTVVLDEPGYVSFDGQPTTSKPATVANGTIQIVPFSYDRAATLRIDYDITDGAGPSSNRPAPLPSVVLFNPSLPSMGRKEIGGGTAEVTGLWPFPDGYSVWAGTCTLNDPAATGGSRPEATIAAPGQTVTANVPLKPIRAWFTDPDGSDADEELDPVAGVDVIARITDTTGCDETQFALGATDEEGLLQAALPYGQWELSAGTRKVTVNVSSDPAVVYPLVVPEGAEDLP
jgi:hypothetical protein